MSERAAILQFADELDAARRKILRDVAPSRTAHRVAAVLAALHARLSRPLRLAIVGEANSGKTSLANTLIGEDVLITDLLRNTRTSVLVQYADAPTLVLVYPDGRRESVSGTALEAVRQGQAYALQIGLPLDRLRDVEILDTPGLSGRANDVRRLEQALRQSDIAIWCTLATQAWRHSETKLWSAAVSRIKPFSLLLATHADALDDGDATKVMERLQREAGAYFGDIALVSLREGATAGRSGLDAFLAKLEALAARANRRRLETARQMVERITAQIG